MLEKTIPHTIPLFTKNIQGRDFPTLGFGTYELEGDTCRQAVTKALETGYRHIDTARVYGNEEAVGLGIQDASMERNDYFVTSKVWWEDLSPENIRAQVDASLEALQIDYLDLVLIHWPNPQYSLEDAIDTFKELSISGKIHLFGVSNFTPSQFHEAVGYGNVFGNQVEYHPLLGQSRLLELVRSHNSALIAYSPLAQGEAIGYDELETIGQKHGKSSEQVALRWLVEQDNVLAIPRSSNPDHIESNFDVFDFELDDEDHRHIARIPKDRRQIDPDFAPDWENENES